MARLPRGLRSRQFRARLASTKRSSRGLHKIKPWGAPIRASVPLTEDKDDLRALRNFNITDRALGRGHHLCRADRILVRSLGCLSSSSESEIRSIVHTFARFSFGDEANSPSSRRPPRRVVRRGRGLRSGPRPLRPFYVLPDRGRREGRVPEVRPWRDGCRAERSKHRRERLQGDHAR